MLTQLFSLQMRMLQPEVQPASAPASAAPADAACRVSCAHAQPADAPGVLGAAGDAESAPAAIGAGALMRRSAARAFSPLLLSCGPGSACTPCRSKRPCSLAAHEEVDHALI